MGDMTVDGRVDMLKVRTWQGERWLVLEPDSGGFIGIARFPNAFAEGEFWEWHKSRMEGILREVLDVLSEGDPDTELDKLRKIITGIKQDRP